MIFLAIDEMQNAECRTQNEAGANDSWRQPDSAFCMLRSVVSQQQSERDEEEARLERFHRQVQAGDE